MLVLLLDCKLWQVKGEVPRKPVVVVVALLNRQVQLSTGLSREVRLEKYVKDVDHHPDALVVN